MLTQCPSQTLSDSLILNPVGPHTSDFQKLPVKIKDKIKFYASFPRIVAFPYTTQQAAVLFVMPFLFLE